MEQNRRKNKNLNWKNLEKKNKKNDLFDYLGPVECKNGEFLQFRPFDLGYFRKSLNFRMLKNLENLFDALLLNQRKYHRRRFL